MGGCAYSQRFKSHSRQAYAYKRCCECESQIVSEQVKKEHVKRRNAALLEAKERRKVAFRNQILKAQAERRAANETPERGGDSTTC